MSETFYSSDTHFGHANIIKHCNRPFSSVEEMNEGLVKAWNDTVTPQDTVYHLGDVTWGYFDINRLNGTKILILGNHDKEREIGKYFDEVHYYLELKKILPKGKSLQLMHYPIESWNGKFHGSLHLHGHTHGTLDNTGLTRFDVGVDCWDMKPVHLDQILELVPKRKEEAEVARALREAGEHPGSEGRMTRDEGFRELNERADNDLPV